MRLFIQHGFSFKYDKKNDLKLFKNAHFFLQELQEVIGVLDDTNLKQLRLIKDNNNRYPWEIILAKASDSGFYLSATSVKELLFIINKLITTKKPHARESVEQLENFLLALSLDKYPNATTPLFNAISEQYQRIAKFLLATDRYDLNAAYDQQGNTLLHIKIIEQDIPAVEFLLRLGANISAKNDDEKTPQQLATNAPNIQQLLDKASKSKQENSSTSALIEKSLFTTVMARVESKALEALGSSNRQNIFG